jgi:hypothetical protein
MHVLIVNFSLVDVSEAGYRQQADGLAPRFTQIPGLISKIWLANAETNTYGGVYLFEDRAALDAFRESETVRAMAANPHFGNLSIRAFGTIEEATAITAGPLAPAYAGW